MIHITHGTGKMRDIPSINTNSLNNPFCQEQRRKKDLVCSKCYGTRLLRYRLKLHEKLDMNSELLSQTRLKLSEVPVLNYLYIRFNSFGELINERHYENLLLICDGAPNTTFALWTKRYEIVSKYPKPANLILIYSEPKLNPTAQFYDAVVKKWPAFDKVFMVYAPHFADATNVQINCQRACIDCLHCYTKTNRIKEIREILK